MKTIGFPISLKENEKRRVLLPGDVKKVKNNTRLFFEKGYGDVLGYNDQDYISEGANVCTRNEVLKKDIICDIKIGDAEYLSLLNKQIIFGYIHAVQNKEITKCIVDNKLTAIAWEDMFENGRHTFYRNNEIAGEAAIMHAYLLHGLFPYNTKVAIIGKGNIARGALKILTMLGAETTVYDRRTEQLLREEISKYDVIVNAILWDTNRSDHILYSEDILRMKKNSMIIDISCDKHGGIETSTPTTIEKPTYFINNVRHYAVDHTPSLFYKTISYSFSNIISTKLDYLIESNLTKELLSSVIIDKGNVIDQRIIEFQKLS